MEKLKKKNDGPFDTNKVCEAASLKKVKLCVHKITHSDNEKSSNSRIAEEVESFSIKIVHQYIRTTKERRLIH